MKNYMLNTEGRILTVAAVLLVAAAAVVLITKIL